MTFGEDLMNAIFGRNAWHRRAKGDTFLPARVSAGMKPQFEKIPYTDGMSFACTTYRNGDCSNPYHLHPEYELTYFVRGHGQWIVGDSMGELRPGFFALLGSNLPHMYAVQRGSGRAEAQVVQFREDAFGAGLFDLPEMRRIRKLLLHAQRGVIFRAPVEGLLRKLAAMVNMPAEGRFLPLLDLLESAASLDNVHCLASISYRPTLQPEEAARINRVVAYLTAHLDSEIYQKDVAQLIGLSNAAFSRFFRRTVKKTFSRFLNEMRISRACHQLTETDDTVTEIAFASGFSNLSNFNRRFMEIRKETPTRFRDRMQRLMVSEEERSKPPRFRLH